jgi:hypothetical protein
MKYSPISSYSPLLKTGHFLQYYVPNSYFHRHLHIETVA